MVPDHMYLTRSTHINLSLANDRVGQSHYCREKGIPDYIPSMSADRSTDPHTVSLLLSTKEVVEKAKHLSTACCYAYQAHISGMQSVRSILTPGGQPIGS
jgi:hypothetical protein